MYRYAIEILRRDGVRVGQKTVEPDLAPLVESARLAYLRRVGPSAASDYDRPVEIEPVWQPKLGEPYVGALSLKMEEDGEPLRAPTTLFRPAAGGVSKHFVSTGALEEGSAIAYLVTAYPDQRGDASPPDRVFRVRELPAHIAVSAGTWVPEGTKEETQPADLRIAVPQRVLDEVAGLTVARRGVETGGALIGHLRWDAGLVDLFVEVTEQIHARNAIGDGTRLQFTPECWTEIRSALALRHRGEMILGWWHSHPAQDWCAQCPRERQETCPLQTGFLSDHDKTLHRTVFPRAFMPALVATDSALGEVQFAVFGWRDGILQTRQFHVLGGDSPPVRGVSGPAGESGQPEEGAEVCAHPK